MRLALRRAVLGMTSLALVSGGAVVTGPAAEAAGPRAQSAADWLSGQLTSGVVHNDQYDFDDYGLTLDFFFAFKGLHVKHGARADILAGIEPVAGSYVGSGGESYAGATGKLATAVLADGGDPTAYGGENLVRRLKGLVRTGHGPQRGRAKDASQYGDYSNTLGQAWVVQAFARAGKARMTRLTVRFLLQQQCRAGYFRESMDSSDFTCQTGRAEDVSAPSVDATALAVMALKAARRSGQAGLGDDIRDGLRWLRDHQHRNGSFSGNGVRNANSTGLAGWALAHSKYDGAARRAARWLARRQATSANAGGTALAGDLGAVAYDKAAFRTGTSDGITAATRDQWRRATAQAAVALDALPAAASRR